MTKAKHIITIEEILSINKEKIRYITLAYSYVRDYSCAEEIFSQCLFKLIQTKDNQYVSDYRSFFTASVKNRCINYLKRQKKACELNQNNRRKERIDIEIERLTAQCGQEEFQTDCPALLEKCRSRMPDLTYEVFMAKRLDRMSYIEISKMFMISRSRINYEINRALKIFREEFKDYLPAIALLISGLLCIGGADTPYL